MSLQVDVTLRRVVHELSQWADAHSMVNDFFGYGEFLQVSMEGARTYPAMVVNVTSAGSDSWYINYSFEVMFLQYVNDEQDNRKRAMSDTREYLNDLEETIRYSNRWQSFSRVDAPFNAVPAVEKGRDKAFGWVGTFTLRVRKRNGICNLQALMPEYDFQTGDIVRETCAPVSIFKDDVFEEDVASGGRFDYSTACADGSITVNSDEFGDVESGETIDVPVKYENGTEVGTIIGGEVIIPNPVVIPTPLIYQRPSPTGEQYVEGDPLFPVGCDSWRVHTGADTIIQLSQGIPMTIDKSKRWKLAHTDNTFGNRFVLTGLTGGYFDPETGNFHDADGSVSSRGSAFPLDYMIDNSTGLGWYLKAPPTNYNWYGSLEQLSLLDAADFSDYFLPNQKEMDSIFDVGYGATFGSSGDTNPIFSTGLTNGTKWTATTIKGLESRAWVYTTAGSLSSGYLKTNIMRYIPCRYHFNNNY